MTTLRPNDNSDEQGKPMNYNQEYRVSLEKETMVFSAAHFITFNGDICESLHGHNYRVKCEVSGPLDENGYVIDFIALRDQLAEIVRQLDHRMLLPTEHPLIRVVADSREVTVTFREKRWIFPLEDCVLLPLANTTAELLANYLGEQLIERCRGIFPKKISKLTVQVDENQGQWGGVTLSWTA
jgi:6-pyruvoyltetrahydropterin/6-carboxytetrahydropterin synthase